MDNPTRRVLELSARGMSSNEVATETCLDSQTVRVLIQTAISELGARSKLEAIIIAARQGFITLAEV